MGRVARVLLAWTALPLVACVEVRTSPLRSDAGQGDAAPEDVSLDRETTPTDDAPSSDIADAAMGFDVVDASAADDVDVSAPLDVADAPSPDIVDVSVRPDIIDVSAPLDVADAPSPDIVDVSVRPDIIDVPAPLDVADAPSPDIVDVSVRPDIIDVPAPTDLTDTGVQCDPGLADCDGNQANGCEVDLWNEGNCGACGTRCAMGSICARGRCAPAPSCPADMVLVPGGNFLMGSEGGKMNEAPIHGVRLSPYCLERTEVTVTAYARCVSAAVCEPPRGVGAGYNWNVAGRDTHPINGVDWEQAQIYCGWSGHPGGARRLPTESQWEFAARGTTGRTYAWGNERPAYQLCWSGVSSRMITCEVGSFPPTGLGFYDLAGNVWEWTADCFGPYSGDAVSYETDPVGPPCSNSRVWRGASFSTEADSGFARAATRYDSGPLARQTFLGIRCARDP